jgi:glycolate oxidase
MARFTWDDLAWLRSETGLPLMLKGVLTPEDAALAVDIGVDVVYVSNHGGLVLDHGPAVTDVLPEIASEVDGRAAIIADGGVMRGTDVVKMLALGADAVGVGRLICWGVAAAGSAGAVRALEILNEEILATMAMVGAASVSALMPELVVGADPLPGAPA